MSDISPFDENPARRPTVEDLGGGQKVDDDPAPEPVTMPTAKDLNELALVGAAVGGMCPLMILVVTQAAGVYSVVGFRCVGSTVVAGDVTVTKNGTGDVTYSWTATKIPGTIAALASLQEGAGDYAYELDTPATVSGTTSVRIKIKDNGGTAQECGHTIFVY